MSNPNNMRLVEYRPGLWLTELFLDDLDVRGAVIAGTKRVVVWDTLSRPSDMAPVVSLLATPALANRELIVVYSHADWDHVWGTAALLAGNPLIVGHELCSERFQSDVPQTLAQFQSQKPGSWQDVELVLPALTFWRRLRLDLGGVAVELHHLPGHTRDCLVVWIPAWGVFLAGDTVETPLAYVGRDSSVPRWIAGLRRWQREERLQTVIPCHGQIGDRGLLATTIGYLETVQSGAELVSDGDALPSSSTDLHARNVCNARHGIVIRPLGHGDRAWVRDFLLDQWGSDIQINRGQVHHPVQMAGFAAWHDDAPVGLVTYHLRSAEVGEIMSLNSLLPGIGIGRRLLDAAVDALHTAGCQRAVVVTTNDNLRALRFYQHAGFVISEVRINALAESRRLKPEIPAIGLNDIPLRDEIELEINLNA